MTDANNGYVALASSSGQAVPLKVDPVSGRLLVRFHKTTDSSPVLNSSKIDANNKPTSMAFDGTDLKPLLIDSQNGYLWVNNA